MAQPLLHTEKNSPTLSFEKKGSGKRPAIFITGGTGYMGSRLIKKLLQKNYPVVALVRKGSEYKLPPGAKSVVANPFDANTFVESVPAGSIFIQLLGVPHPSPKKAILFKEIDLKSVKASADAAAKAGVSHFIYVSVSMTESKIMKAYQEVRKEGEEYCLYKNLSCTFIRPWYVLGPGHWWPVLLLPFYGIAELVPAWRPKARSKALVTIHQMIRTLERAIEEVFPSVFEIKNIRKGKMAVQPFEEHQVQPA